MASLQVHTSKINPEEVSNVIPNLIFEIQNPEPPRGRHLCPVNKKLWKQQK